MKFNSNIVLIASLVALFTGCASRPTVQESELTSIRSVAIVGFSVLSEVPDPLAGMAGGSSMGMGLAPSQNTFAKQSDFAAKILKGFSEDLQRQLRWTTLAPDVLVRNDVYGDLYVDRMKNWQNKTTPDKAFQIHFVKNVLPISDSNDFTPLVRDRMIETLKVDALIEVEIKNQLSSSFSVNNLGSKKGESVVQFRVYKKGVASPVWEDRAAKGPASNKSLGFGFGNYTSAQEPSLFSMYEESAHFAATELLNRRDVLGQKN